ncbi:androgen-induced gene 1 protein-like isoform X2 [Cimex lectularius]|nr:androgen-induced gene 1 protein-like isoform X2 [Cimex lectularius]XP_014262021.1 androgen-induced gene 1 protein-like isoform X2 [Cimex lectularius]
MEVQYERKHNQIYLYVSTFVHTVGVLNFSAGICCRLYKDITHEDQDFYMRFAYSFKYVTMLNAVIQLGYFVVALTVDIMAICSYTLDAPNGWLKARSFFRCSIAIPCGLYTCVMFWIFHWYDVALLGDYNSPWLRHTLYTSNVIILLFDVIFCKGESSEIVISLLVINAPCLLYFIWLHIIYYCTGVWAVSFVKNLTLVERLLMYVGTVLEHWVGYFIGRLLNDILWNEDFVARIPFLRRFVSVPPRFIYGNPSNESLKIGKVLSGTENMFVDRPVKKKKTQPKRKKIP